MSIIFISVMMLRGQQVQAHQSRPKTIGQRALQSRNPIDFDSCFANLDISNANADGYLNQTEYLEFVQRAANGTLDETWYGTPIDQFYLLPQEYIGLYNLLACGNANIGCPTIAGIYIGGYQLLGTYIAAGVELSAEQYFKWSNLCKQYDLAITAVPTNAPTKTLDNATLVPTKANTNSPISGSTSLTPTIAVESTPPSPMPVTLAPTSLSNVPVSSLAPAVVVDVNDPPFTGTIVSTFEYEIYNTVSLNSKSIITGTNPNNNAMSVLVQSTTDFVDDVVDAKFGTIRERGRTGKGRRLAVTIGTKAVSIDLVQDIFCSQPVTVKYCQKVTASTKLTVTDEPKMSTELKFKISVSRALKNPGITLPAYSGLVYVGPIDPSTVIVIPNVTDPEGGSVSPDGDGNDTPGWVVPVSIGAAALGVVALLLLVGVQLRKRSTRREPRGEELEGEFSDSDGTNVINADGLVEVSPLEVFPDLDLESGKRMKANDPNPFLDSVSDADSSVAGQSESSSGSSSSSSSDENLDEESDGEISRRDEIKRMHLIAVEALVMEACPENAEQIGNMMVEYDGREEVLLNKLSRMLEAKDRAIEDVSTSTLRLPETSPRNSIQSNEVVSTTGERTNVAATPNLNPFNNDDDSSSSGTSDWSSESSDDGFSSIESSTLDKSDLELSTAAVLAAAESNVTDDYDSKLLRFTPVQERSSKVSDYSNDKNDAVVIPSREDSIGNYLDEAIEAGDWTAVKATAALMANVDESASERKEEEDSMYASQNSYSTHERNQVAEFDELVEQGNWEAIMAAASRFEETASNLGSMDESRHSMDDSLTSLEDSQSIIARKQNQERLRAEIQALVRDVVPDELENIDEMLLQYDGREEDLLLTLRTMQGKSNLLVEEGDDKSSPDSLSFTTIEGSRSVYEHDREDSTISSGLRMDSDSLST